MPYQLGYATKEVGAATKSNSHHLVYKTSALKPIELHRNLVDREGFKPSQEVCRTSMLSLHHQPVLNRVSVEVKYRNTDWTNLVAMGGFEPPASRL